MSDPLKELLLDEKDHVWIEVEKVLENYALKKKHYFVIPFEYLYLLMQRRADFKGSLSDLRDVLLENGCRIPFADNSVDYVTYEVSE